jgi:hypothetical protein
MFCQYFDYYLMGFHPTQLIVASSLSFFNTADEDALRLGQALMLYIIIGRNAADPSPGGRQ